MSYRITLFLMIDWLIESHAWTLAMSITWRWLIVALLAYRKLIANRPSSRPWANDTIHSATMLSMYNSWNVANVFVTRLYKVWFCCHPTVFFTFVCNSRTRGHSLKLFLPDSRVNCRQHFFAVHVLRIWNSLPEDVVSATQLSLFISRLVRVNLNQFLIGKL